MTWSTQQIDSLPGGVRALPRSLRAAWVGAASAAKDRGSNTAEARKRGDTVVSMITKGLADIGLMPEALEGWGPSSVDHPLLSALHGDTLEQAAGAFDEAAAPAGEPGSFASWLATMLMVPSGSAVTTDLPAEPEEQASTDRAPALTGTAALSTHADGSSWRVDRIAFDLTSEGKDAVDRALNRARKLEKRGDSSFEAVIEQLRKDGFDDYVTPEGYLRVRVRAARTGTQQYSDGISIWGEYRPPEEVFAPPSLASWGYKPFTNDHPPDFVGIHNWAEYAVGVVGDDASRAAAPDGDEYVEITLVVYGFDALVAIRGGKVELSAGYSTKLRREQGRDSKGREYRFRQTDIYINHLALVDRGRAGPLARLNLDGFAWMDASAPNPTDTEDTTMPTSDTPKIKVDLADGVSVELSQAQADALKASTEKRIADEADKRAKEYLSAAKAEQDAKDKPVFDAMTAQIESLSAKIDGVVTAKAETDAKLVSLQAENAQLKADADARQRAEVMATIKTACPKLDLSKIEGPKNDAGETSTARICDLKAAAVCDLNPSFADAIADYRKQGDGFERFVDSLFAVELGKAKTNDRVADPERLVRVRTLGSQKVDLNSMRSASLGQSTESAAN